MIFVRGLQAILRSIQLRNVQKMLPGMLIAAVSLSLSMHAVSQSSASTQNSEVAEIYKQAGASADEAASNGFLLANGFAKYIELENDIYIGALFLGRLSNDPATIFDMEAKRMEMKIVPTRFAYKRFGQLLIKSSAINNAPKALVRNAEAMEEFLSVFRGNLVQGDHIVLANLPEGFSVSMNGVELAVIESPDLFNMLLNIWIGTVPPSRDFRTRILGGENNTEFQAAFASLKYSPARLAEVASWKMHQDALADAETDQAQAVAEAQTQGSVSVPKVAAAPSPAPTKPRQVKSTADQEVKAAVKPAAKKVTPAAQRDIDDDDFDDNTSLVAAIELADGGSAKAKTLTKNSLAQSADTLQKNVDMPDLNAVTNRDASDSQKTVAKANPTKPKTKKPVEESFSAKGLLAMQLYVNKLLIHSQLKMEYPKMARRLRQEGKVIASVTVDRKGKLIRYEITDESKFKSLNNAVEKGIKSSEPFPDVPEDIEGEDFTFSVPVNFRYSG